MATSAPSSSTTSETTTGPQSTRDALLGSRRFRFLGLNAGQLIKGYFGGNALAAIIVLVLIMVFLFREGYNFFPQNLQNLRTYRQAGLEYVDILREPAEGFSGLVRKLNTLRQQQAEKLRLAGRDDEALAAEMAPFDGFVGAFGGSGRELNGLVSDLREAAAGIKERVEVFHNLEREKSNLLALGKTAEAEALPPTVPVDLAAESATLRTAAAAHTEVYAKLRDDVNTAVAGAPVPPGPGGREGMDVFRKQATNYLETLPKTESRLTAWRQDAPVSWTEALSSFFFGRTWETGNLYWQEFYGLIPLFVGSLMISALALAIAVPLGVGGAIYCNQLAAPTEARFLKPAIEFIAAFPSVVLGFFGVAVLGEFLRWTSGQAWLSWLPFFPMSERLTIATAGILLGLMAVPTIFSLSEDALHNVPRAFKEAAYAMGSTRLQTILRVLVPTALSGIIAAVLLGFGRVIGETMVVLLCAGNRIAIPDFSQGGLGLGAWFQPAHTMTGIIAQELGEVETGGIHYRALFMVGLVLFFLSLLINFGAQKIVRRYRMVA